MSIGSRRKESEISGICLFLVTHLNHELTRAAYELRVWVRARAQLKPFRASLMHCEIQYMLLLKENWRILSWSAQCHPIMEKGEDWLDNLLTFNLRANRSLDCHNNNTWHYAASSMFSFSLLSFFK